MASLARSLYISKKKRKNMEKEIYIMLVRGSDGQFCFSDAFETFEAAEKALNANNDIQIILEGAENSQYDIDKHELERLSIPGFVINSDDVLMHTTLSILNEGTKIIKTDRYIVRLTNHKFI